MRDKDLIVISQDPSFPKRHREAALRMLASKLGITQDVSHETPKPISDPVAHDLTSQVTAVGDQAEKDRTTVHAEIDREIYTKPGFPRWKCHKVVEAVKICSISKNTPEQEVNLYYGPGLVIVTDIGYATKHNPQEGGYYVRYEGGYESYSPAMEFESGYSLLD